MPALQLFNRRTIFAGDDLQPTAILTSFAHLAQFLLLVLPVFIHVTYECNYMLQPHENNDNGNEGDENDNGKFNNFVHYLFGNGEIFYDDEECNAKAHYFPLLLYIFLLLTTIHIILSLFFESIIYKLSSIGSPTQSELRNPLLGNMVERKWIWLSIVGNIVVLSIGFAALGTSTFYFTCRDVVYEEREKGNDNNENGNQNYLDPNGDLLSLLFGKHTWWFLLILLQSSQLVQLLVSTFALTSLLRKEKVGDFEMRTMLLSTVGSGDSDGNGHGYERHNDHHHLHHELAEEMWSQRCQSFCKCAASSTCYLFGGRDLVDGVTGDYGQVSRALADYFEDGGVLDVATSDIAAGFMMLQRRQRQRILAARKRINDDLLHGKSQNTATELDIPSSSSRNLHVQNSSGSLSSLPARKDSSNNGSSSTLSWDAHNFGQESHPRISSVVDPNIDPATLTLQIGEIPQYQNASLHDSHHKMDEDLLASILQPMPYTGTLLLPTGQLANTNDPADFLSTPTAAWTLKKSTEEGNYKAQKRKVFNRNDPIDTNVIAEGARFARHALSIYTWVLYVYMKPLRGPPNLIYNRLAEFCNQCKSKHSSQNSHGNPDGYVNTDADGDDGVDSNDSFFCNVAHGNTTGDNCFHAHRNSLLAHSGLDESDLIYANFNNKYNQMPYCIVIDHKWQSVVLAIRGTLSLEDCLVDVLVDPDPLDELGREYGFDGDDQYCHSGVLSCVKYILNDLKRHNILNSLLTGIGAPYAHYTFRITGHSLGGGCAALLGYVMKQQFPNLRVVAISPPGGFISWRMATECKDFVTSFVLDSDLVPRLSHHSMEQLRDEVLEMISRIKVPKMQVVRTFVVNGILRSHKETTDPEKLAHDNAKILHSKENIPTDTEFYRQMEKFKAIQQERKDKRGEYRNISLFPPGNMIHLVKIDERRSCLQTIAKCVTCCTSNAGYQYTPVYVNNDDFDEITITPTMGFDHFPNRVCLELERVAEAFGIDTSLGSSKRDHENAERMRLDTNSVF